MDLTKAIELFEEIKKRFNNHQSNFSEFRTRIMLIDPILRLLGWEVENPDLVVLEYQPNTQNRKSADYVLKNKGKNVVIVEAKNIDIDIESWEHRDQADDYARYAEVKFFVLTNGVTWMLYERDLMTSLELLKPIVRFDIVHDKPYQCALAALSIWKPNLTSEEPVFISPKAVSSQSYSKSSEQQEQRLSNDSSKDSDNWCSFEDKIYPPDTDPAKLKIGNSPSVTVKGWTEAIHKVVAWLADEDILSVNDCPIGTATYTFIGRKAVNPDGTPFKNPQELSNVLILQGGYVNTQAQWRKLRQLLGDLGENRSTIRVSYESSRQPNR